MNDKSLTTKKMAEYCQVSQRTIVQWIHEGKIKSFRTLGKHIRVQTDDFVEFLKKNNIPVPDDLVTFNHTNTVRKILIVDDDKDMAHAIRRSLQPEKNLELEVAYDGFDAGKKFVEIKPDLIVLDIHMPGMNGYELCANIRRDNTNVRILAISGVVKEADIRKILDIGADDFLAKPFENRVLLSKVFGLLGRNRRSKDNSINR